MLDYKEIFEKANKDYQEFMVRSNPSVTGKYSLTKEHEFVIKAIIEAFYAEPKKKKSLLDFTKGNDE